MSLLTATQPADPIVVEIAADAPPWWEIVGALAPLAVLLAAVLATATAFATLRQRAAADRAALEQKRRADDRAEWWRRTQWAIDAATSLDPIRQEAGVEALLQLSYSDLATEEDRLILDAIWVSNPVANPDDPDAGLPDGVAGQSDEDEG
jgi:GAF domain-containing protein